MIYVLEMYEALEDIDISVIVRDALCKYIAGVYFALAKDKYI